MAYNKPFVKAQSLFIDDVEVTATAAELNIMDGVTATKDELNILDGVTATKDELNILDGVTATKDELNILDGVTSTYAELNLLDGVTSTTEELNILDGVTSTASELNILDGVTSTASELNILDGAIASAVPVLTAGAATDEMDITITVKDAAGSTIAQPHILEVWITDSDTNFTLTGTAASGALTAVDGAVLQAITAKKHITCITPATGIINLSLVDSANTAGEIVCVRLPNGLFSQSAASVTGSYEGG